MSKTMYEKEFTFHDKNNKVINGEVEIYWINERWELHIRLEDYELNPEYTELQQEFIDYCNSFGWNKFVTEEIEEEVKDNLDNYIENIEEEFDNLEYSWDDYYNFLENNSFPDDLEELDNKVIALAQHLDISPSEAKSDIEEISYDDCAFTYGRREYYIYDENEREREGEERAENLIEDCYIKRELRDSWIYRHFDMDSAIEDVINNGYGNLLSSYDGQEYEEKVYGTTYYIYRSN